MFGLGTTFSLLVSMHIETGRSGVRNFDPRSLLSPLQLPLPGVRSLPTAGQLSDFMFLATRKVSTFDPPLPPLPPPYKRGPQGETSPLNPKPQTLNPQP